MPTLNELGSDSAVFNTLDRLGATRRAAQATTPALSNFGRSRFVNELADPAVRDRLIAYTQAEVGGQGPRAQQAFIESILNRAVARNQPLQRTLSGSYFPDVTHQRAARGVNEAQRLTYTPLISEVLGGSNVSNYATGNASGTVGFAGGPQTAAFGGERYGVEGPDRGWWTRVGSEGPSNTQAVGYTGGGTPVVPPSEQQGQQGFSFGRFLSGLGDFRPAQVQAAPPFQFGSSSFRFAPLGARRGYRD
jgi:hypothetical protein